MSLALIGPVLRMMFPWLVVGFLMTPYGTVRAENAADAADALAEIAVTEHPSLDALRARVDALQSVAQVARLWRDPVLVVEASNLPVSEPLLDRHPMAGVQFGLRQQLPAPGVTAGRERVAQARMASAEAEFAPAVAALRGEVRARFNDLMFIRRMATLTDQHVRELDRLLDIVRKRYELGEAAQHDLMRLRLRRDRLAETTPDLEARAAAILAALNGALARDPGTPVSTPTGWTDLGLPATPDARSKSLERHPLVLALNARAEADGVEATQSRAEAAPDPTVWLGYRVRTPQSNGDPGTNFVSAGVSVPVPVASGRRWSGLASSSEARARASRSLAAAEATRLAARLAAAEARHARARIRAERHRGPLIRLAEDALQSVRSAYRVGRASFDDLTRAEIELLDVRRSLLLAEAEAAAARAEILTLVEDGLKGTRP